jgi:hypothetical protein
MAADKTKETMESIGIDPAIAPKHAPSSSGAVDPLTKIRIDGQEYDFAALPEEARRLIIQMRIADQEISRAQALLAMMQEARRSYGARLTGLLPKT